jgi:hypothetical protein
MRIAFWIGVLLVAAGLVVVIVGNTGAGISVPSIVLGGVLFVLGGTTALTTRSILRMQARAAAAVDVLVNRGARRDGIVRDVVPYADPAGGAVVQPEGAQLVIRIELAGGERVTCHLVEDSEVARARIGKPIVVVEHPDDASLRAIEGYLPNGLRLAK